MSMPPRLADLQFSRPDDCPPDMKWKKGGELFYGDGTPPRVWVALNMVPTNLTLKGNPHTWIEHPPFLHYDLMITLREKQEGGERKRWKEKIGYIDTRENTKTGKPFYVVTLWAMPVVRASTKGCLWLMADTKLA